MIKPLTIHLIANAHLDPVWLWDWREGLNEGIITVRTILDLLDEDPELTFIRGEAAIYQHIERREPETFARIAAHVKSGRWDVVGGTSIQPDTNLASTETLARQFVVAQRYFQSRFGKTVKVAWQADSFGHSAGLPEIFSAAGIESFAFTRPDQGLLPLSDLAFWWVGESGARVLAYRPDSGAYISERHGVKDKLDALVRNSGRSHVRNHAVFFGLGNHGGGPSRRQVADIREWASEHPEHEVVFSGLHRLFAGLRRELAGKGDALIPAHRGELNYCLRGCYSSLARLKTTYRRAENLLGRAENTDAVISAAVGKPARDLTAEWDGVLFNSFHDILPGSCIERAAEDQTAWLGSVIHSSQKTEFDALNALADAVDTRVDAPPADHPSAVAALVWNPHPFPFKGQVEIEAALDYRPIWEFTERTEKLPVQVNGPSREPIPFQEIRTEHSSMVDLAWRKRVVVPVNLPAFGWNVLEFGWRRDAKNPAVKNPVTSGADWIDNGLYRVEARPGASGPAVFHRGKSLFGKAGLSAAVFEDPWGSWGGMTEEPDAIRLNALRERWKVTQVEVLEQGPQRATLWVRLAGKRSRIDLSISLSREREAADIQARVFWDERSARLKLILPVGDQAEFEVPGGSVKRGPAGQVPGIGWVRVGPKLSGFGFTSDALYDFDTQNGEFRPTVVRATRYANDVRTPPGTEPWRPAADSGELKLRFVLAPGSADLPALTRELQQPPIVLLVPPKNGPLGRSGSLAELSPASLKLVAIKRAENSEGVVVRVQAPAGKAVAAKLSWLGKTLALGSVRGGELASWLLAPSKSGWKAARVFLDESPLG